MEQNNIISAAGVTILMALFAPLVSGMIRKAKNILRMRIGPGVLQPYYDLHKLLLKDEVVSGRVSWIFYATPVIVFVSSLLALFLILMLNPGSFMNDGMVILITALLVLGLGRFFLALAGLDAGSSFGGMGSSREMFISSFAEPAAFIAVFVLCISYGSVIRVSGFLAGIALFMVAIAETSRVPVDNRETHLELTMVHEAMVLEYSGRSLALIELASHVKQVLFFTVLSWCFFPHTVFGICGLALFLIEIAVIGLVIALVEISMAKMRLFRAVDFLSFSFFVALVASIAASLGL